MRKPVFARSQLMSYALRGEIIKTILLAWVSAGAPLGCPRLLLRDSATPTVTDLAARQCHEVTTLIC
jgi:hypothetical protein